MPLKTILRQVRDRRGKLGQDDRLGSILGLQIDVSAGAIVLSEAAPVTPE
jgi:hypothetical protein